MPRSIRRSLLASIALLAVGCGPEERSAPIDPQSIQVQMGTGGLWREGRWARVRVRARTKEKVFRGDVEVSGIDGQGRTAPEIYRKRFEVAGESQAIEIPALPLAWSELAVTFRGEGIPEETVVQRISSDSSVRLRILIIGTHRLAALPPAFESTLGCKSEEIEVKAIAAGDLPLHFLGYQAADLVIVDGDSLLDADHDRLLAIREWVERGGTIALVPNPSWRGKLPEKAIDLFGLGSAVRRNGETDQLLALEPLPGARLVANGLLLENRFGSGAAYLHAFAPPAIFPPEAFGPLELSRAWGQIAARAFRSREESSLLDKEFEPEAIRVLAGFSGLRYPSRTRSILFVVGYAAIAFGLSGLFFRRARRLERMYVIAVALAVLSSIAIWRFGILSSIKEFGIDQISVARIRPGTTLADARTYVGLSSPTRRVLRPEPGSDGLGPWIPSQPPDSVLPLDYRASGPGLHIPEIPLLPNATRFLRFDGPLDLGGKLEAELGVGPGGMPRINIKNSTRFPLSLHLIKFSNMSRKTPFGMTHCLVFDLKSLPAGESDLRELDQPAHRFINQQGRILPGNHVIDGVVQGHPPPHLVSELLNSLIGPPVIGGAYLVAVPKGPLTTSSFLGPVRNSLGFLILEVVPEKDR